MIQRSGLAFGVVLLCLAAPARAESIAATYTVHAAGLTVMELHAVLDLTEQGYSVELRTRLRGVASIFGDGQQVTRVSGIWAPAGVQPLRYVADGVWRGEARRTVLEWPGGQPAVRLMVPPNEAEREPVPAMATRGTMDSLSALALLIHQVQRSGTCDARANVYDGRRLSEMSGRTEGLEQFPPSRGEWSGRAVKCRFEGRQTAGFRRDDGGEEARRPQGGIAWVAEVQPGRPPLPVRVEAPSRWFGTVTARLAQFGPPGQ
jgi:hypothetical protein